MSYVTRTRCVMSCAPYYWLVWGPLRYPRLQLHISIVLSCDTHSSIARVEEVLACPIVASRFLGRFSNDVWCIDTPRGRFVVKVPFRSPRPGETLGSEASFYARMRTYPNLPIVRCLNPESSDGLLIFDYHDFEPFDFFDGVSKPHGWAAMDALGAWHAARSTIALGRLSRRTTALTWHGFRRILRRPFR